MLTDRSWLDAAETMMLIAAFDAAGVDFRFVGGAVRDALLGRPVSDIDVATPALPKDITRAVSAAGLKAIPTGIAHGTVTALVGGRHFEITTLRRDVETDGRHAIVAFTEDWRQDAARRDFTMNALYADRDGRITDFFGGTEDAKTGRVRFIGDPAQRITEDGLRILRFFRFHAWYGAGDLDPDGLKACTGSAAMIDRVSGERVRDELFKLLRARDPAPVWRAMIGAGILPHIAPGAVRIEDLTQLIATEQDLKLAPDPLRRLAALIAAMDGNTVEGLKSRLRLSNQDAQHLAALPALSARLGWVERGEFARALYGAEPDWVLDAAVLAQIPAGPLRRFIQDWHEPRFPLSGDDLAARGVSPGPEMGRLLRQVEAWWVAGGLTASRQECLAELDRQ